MGIVKTDNQHYSDIAQAIRSKSGGYDLYKPAEMAAAIMELEIGSQGSAIIVYALSGSEITCTCGNLVRTVPENGGVWQFDNCGPGTWVVTAAKDGMTQSYTVEILEETQLMRYEVWVSYVKIYGIQRDRTQSSPEWVRTDEAVGKTATASVGTAAGSSDFDDCYPWNGIQRVTFDGSNGLPNTGDVMVRIPKFYYKRWLDGDVEHIQIADNAAQGFKLHPVFVQANTEKDCVYMAAYNCNDGYESLSNQNQMNMGMTNFRTGLNTNKGSGFYVFDIRMLSAIQMLFLVEFATYDSQTAVGNGLVSVSQSSRGKTGTTDSVPNLTGIPTGTNGKVDVVYRGMETLWGTGQKAIDGALTNGSEYLIGTDLDAYNSTGADYHTMSYAGTTVGSEGYAKTLGYEEGEYDFVMLPDSGGGSSSTYVCDLSYIDSAFCAVGGCGRYDSGTKGGLFYCQSVGTNNGSISFVNRFIYVPQEVSV